MSMFGKSIRINTKIAAPLPLAKGLTQIVQQTHYHTDVLSQASIIYCYNIDFRAIKLLALFSRL